MFHTTIKTIFIFNYLKDTKNRNQKNFFKQKNNDKYLFLNLFL